ncbi:hypothetical protein DB32_002407 [Sandaracinus amylolyticus]|uniref:Uncharacterized protein n=1 Tax=Sandaracinus amylolyticus TaxID=927083 RepID=A0A0F6W203_9BACT|nr:hypothetical protein DB32_002407 [Sandaracinus amylolyticus]
MVVVVVGRFPPRERPTTTTTTTTLTLTWWCSCPFPHQLGPAHPSR